MATRFVLVAVTNDARNDDGTPFVDSAADARLIGRGVKQVYSSTTVIETIPFVPKDETSR